MAKTIEQIQTMITKKYDAREVINEIADYLQENPGGGGSGGGTILQSPDSTLWQVQINDSGVLVTAQVTSGTAGTLHLFSPDNTEWNVTVTNAGALETTAI
jgi:hypothetical protein